MTVCLLVLFNPISYALPDDQDKILTLSADRADLSQTSHRGEFIGNVELDQGTTHLRAAKATTMADNQNTLIEAIAKGNAKAQAHYWSLTAPNKPLLHAYANSIYYYPQKHLIKLIGNAKVSQGKHSFTAPEIIYDTVKQHVVTKASENQRTLITLYPEKTSHG